MTFELDEKEQQKFDKWAEVLLKDEAYTGAIGGRFTYQFTPTGLGVIVKVRDEVTKQEIDLTDYDLW